MRKYLSFLLVIALSSILIACENGFLGLFEKKDSNPTGDLKIEFRARYNTIPLVMNNGLYTNEHDDTLVVTDLNYYVSNIVLENANGDDYIVPQEDSYYLIRNNSQADRTIDLSNVPEGDYVAMRFTVGVDSSKSTADASERTDDLDVIENADMYWAWNSGYIFFKMEGTSPQGQEINGQNQFRYHIGGFGGYNTPTINNLREARVGFNNLSAQVRAGGQAPFVILGPNIYRFFGAKHKISIKDHPVVMLTPTSSEVADNIAEMFEFDHLHNYQ